MLLVIYAPGDTRDPDVAHEFTPPKDSDDPLHWLQDTRAAIVMCPEKRLSFCVMEPAMRDRLFEHVDKGACERVWAAGALIVMRRWVDPRAAALRHRSEARIVDSVSQDLAWFDTHVGRDSGLEIRSTGEVSHYAPTWDVLWDGQTVHERLRGNQFEETLGCYKVDQQRLRTKPAR